MPIARPPLNNIVNAPNEPADPPSHNDVLEALRYTKKVTLAIEEKTLENIHLSHAVAYEHSIVHAKALQGQPNALPPGLQNAINQALAAALPEALNQALPAAINQALPAAINQALPEAINQALEPLKQQIEQLKIAVGEVGRTGAMGYNHSCDDGEIRNFRRVPFRNGKLPGPNLPPITDVQSLADMTVQNRRRYYRGYYGGRGQFPDDLNEKILAAIGYRST